MNTWSNPATDIVTATRATTSVLNPWVFWLAVAGVVAISVWALT
jgi:hypothetical protein